MSNKNRNRGQFQNNRTASQTAANLEDDTTDKFEDDDTVEEQTREGEQGQTGIQGTYHLNEDGSPVVTDPTPVVKDLVVARIEGSEAFNAAGEAIGVIGPTGHPGLRGDEGVSAAEESVEDEQSALEDEREGEDPPEANQDHEDFDELSGDSSLSRTEIEARLGARLEDVATRVETKVIDSLDITTTAPDEPAAPVFPFTDISTWTLEELQLYISRPENMDIYHSKLVQAITIHRQLVPTLNEAWSTDECTAFFKDGVEPPKATTGCYLNDVTRKLRREASWTTQELEAWALGEIQPEGLVTRNGLAIQLYERFHMQIKSVDAESVITHYKHNFGPNKGQVKLVGQIPVAAAVQPAPAEVKAIEQKIKYAGLTEMNQSYIEETLKQYCDAVRPNRVVSPRVGEEAQRQLHNVVLAILKEADPVGVKSGLDILFKTIVAERLVNTKGVFNDTNIFRFVDGITSVGKAQEIHRRLFTLFFAFIDGDEGVLGQTDVSELIKYLPSNQQNQLLAYFGRS